MKYFGTYNNDSDLVPKSYVDSAISSYINSNIDSYINNILYSHDEYDINTAFRLIQLKDPKEVVYYDWDNYTNISQSGYVEAQVDTRYRFSSITFVYDNTDSGLSYNLPGSLSGIRDSQDNLLTPSTGTIYYVLGLEPLLKPGRDLFVFMKAEDRFVIGNYKIRVLIPCYYTNPDYSSNDPTSGPPTYGIFYNGKWISGSDENTYTRNGYIDIGYYQDANYSSNDYFLSATLHIYFDGTNYYIDRLPVDNTTHST